MSRPLLVMDQKRWGLVISHCKLSNYTVKTCLKLTFSVILPVGSIKTSSLSSVLLCYLNMGAKEREKKRNTETIISLQYKQ